jgi:DNA-binding MarR family transcriptional regulator
MHADPSPNKAAIRDRTVSERPRRACERGVTLTGAVDRLEAQGLVRRVDSERDRRAYVLEHRLTSRQRERMERVIREGKAACFGVLTAAERKELLRLLEKCSPHLEAEAHAR